MSVTVKSRLSQLEFQLLLWSHTNPVVYIGTQLSWGQAESPRERGKSAGQRLGFQQPSLSPSSPPPRALFSLLNQLLQHRYANKKLWFFFLYSFYSSNYTITEIYKYFLLLNNKQCYIMDFCLSFLTIQHNADFSKIVVFLDIYVLA